MDNLIELFAALFEGILFLMTSSHFWVLILGLIIGGLIGVFI